MGASFEVTAPARKLNILVVDDESVIAKTLTHILNIHGFSATEAHSGFEAIEYAKSVAFDVLITDFMMPGLNGIETAKQICKIVPQCRVILLSGTPATAQIFRHQDGVGRRFEIHTKPLHPTVLIELLKETRSVRTDGA